MVGVIDPEDEGRRHFVSTLALSALGATLPGCELVRRRWRYRYKLAAEVESNGKIYSGSSVIEIIRQEANAAVEAHTNGEATVVDIPGAESLFFLLKGKLGFGNWAYTVPHYAFSDVLGSESMTRPEVLDRLVALKGATSILRPDLYPEIVKFKDIRQPQSVELVIPTGPRQYLGNDAYLRQVRLEITDQPVTKNIISRLPWLRRIKGSLIKYERGKSLGQMPFGGGVNDGDFIQGTANGS